MHLALKVRNKEEWRKVKSKGKKNYISGWVIYFMIFAPSIWLLGRILGYILDNKPIYPPLTIIITIVILAPIGAILGYGAGILVWKTYEKKYG